MTELKDNTVQQTLCMPLWGRKIATERFPGGMITFDAVNAMGLKGVNAKVRMSGNETKSFFSLEKPKKELEDWSDHIVNVMERDYMDGYLKDGWRKSIVTRIFAWVMRTFHMSFMIHAEFMEKSSKETADGAEAAFGK